METGQPVANRCLAPQARSRRRTGNTIWQPGTPKAIAQLLNRGNSNSTQQRGNTCKCWRQWTTTGSINTQIAGASENCTQPDVLRQESEANALMDLPCMPSEFGKSNLSPLSPFVDKLATKRTLLHFQRRGGNREAHRLSQAEKHVAWAGHELPSLALCRVRPRLPDVRVC